MRFPGPRYCSNFRNSTGGEDICRLAVINNSSHVLVDQVVEEMELELQSATQNCSVLVDIVTIGPGKTTSLLPD